MTLASNRSALAELLVVLTKAGEGRSWELKACPGGTWRYEVNAPCRSVAGVDLTPEQAVAKRLEMLDEIEAARADGWL